MAKKIKLDLSVTPLQQEGSPTLQDKFSTPSVDSLSLDRISSLVASQMPEIKTKLKTVLEAMSETNPNMHPIKFHILNNWKITIAECISDFTRLLEELSTNLPTVQEDEAQVSDNNNA